MLVDLMIKYFKGKVYFKCEGIMGEELISDCIKNQIYLSNVKVNNCGFNACINIDDYKKVASLAAKRGMRTKVKKRKGLRFVIFKNRKRYGLLLGFVIFVAVLTFLSSRVWNINISGNQNIPDYVIMDNLDKLGVYIGANVKGLDAVNVEREMLLNVDGLSFIAVNFMGTNVDVEISEVRHSKYMVDNDTQPANIVAAKTGQIVSIEAYDGMPVVKKGDTVLKGDLIISGIVDGKTGKTHFRNASGKVLANVEEIIEAKVCFDQTDFFENGENETIPFLRIGKYRLNFSTKKIKDIPYSLDENVKNLTLFGKKLPIEVGVDIYNYIASKQVKLTREQAKEICLKSVAEEEETRFRNCKIISKIPISKVEMNAFVITCRYIVEMDIAQSVNILTE